MKLSYIISILFVIQNLTVTLSAQDSTQIEEFAHASSSDVLATLSFEELLNVKVNISSKTDEDLLKSTGTVYILTSREFERYGWRTVGEALHALPGIDISENYRYTDGGHRGFGSDFSETILLLDGKEIQKQRNGRASQPLMIYPTHQVERIEVLQGPASTLYGSHALQGVINIITKSHVEKNESNDVMEADFILGEANTNQLAFSSSRQIGDVYMALSAHHFYSDRNWKEVAEFYSEADNLRKSDDGTKDYLLSTDPDDFNNYELDQSMQFYSKYKGFYFGFDYFNMENLHSPGGKDYSGALKAGLQESLLYFGHKYEHNALFKTDLQVERLFQRDIYQEIFSYDDSLTALDPNSTLSVSDIDREDFYYFPESQRWDSKIWKVKFNGELNTFKNNKLVIGLEGWHGDYFGAIGANTFFPMASDELDWTNTKNNKFSVYFQDQHNFFSDRLILLAGFRYNKQDYTQTSITPRVSLVGEPIKGSVFKASFSEGYRALNFAQFGQAVGTVAPTIMDMWEINYTQNISTSRFKLLNSLSYYSMLKTGILSRLATPDGIGVYWTNTGGSKQVSGIENMLKADYDWLSGFLSVYWVNPKEKSISSEGESYLRDIPEYKVKLGLTAELHRHFEISTFIDHWGETKWQITNYDAETRTILPGGSLYTQAAFSDIDVLLHFIDLKPLKSEDLLLDITLSASNILNTQYSHHLRAPAKGNIQAPRRFWIKTNISF